MRLSERGLLISMKWACWSNDTIPADPAHLALVLGLSETEVRSNLTPAVMDFFAPAKGYSERLECPELAAQMARLMQRREAQSRAAELTNAQRNANRSGKRNAKRSGMRHALEKSRTEKNQTEKSAVKEAHEVQQHPRKGNGGAPDAEFVAGIEREEAKQKTAGGAPAINGGSK